MTLSAESEQQEIELSHNAALAADARRPAAGGPRGESASTQESGGRGGGQRGDAVRADPCQNNALQAHHNSGAAGWEMQFY